jgi:DNA-binding response OmpR family regulator
MNMKKTLLAIDDEKTILKLLQHFFKDKYEVIIMANGQEALIHLQNGHIPDAIIADVNMPELNGYEFIEHIRNSAYFRHIPLVMLSGNDSTQDKIKSLRLGADDYLVKPFNPEELDARIENIFRRIKRAK